jgi:hypothetical protein
MPKVAKWPVLIDSRGMYIHTAFGLFRSLGTNPATHGRILLLGRDQFIPLYKTTVAIFEIDTVNKA